MSCTQPPARRPRHIGGFIALVAVAAVLGAPAPAAATVTASVVSGQLRVASDAAGDSISLRVSADTLRIEVRQGAGLVGSFLRSTFTSIAIGAGGGSDTVLIDEVNGAFTNTTPTIIDGGDGNDHITGGIGAEIIDGGAGDDFIDAGRGNDSIAGGGGDDTFFWAAGGTFLSPHDGNDFIEGGAGDDALQVNGNGADEVYALSASGQRALLTRDVGAVTLNIGTTEALGVQMFGGFDTFTADPDVQTVTSVSINGGDGFDSITGGSGNDVLYGGDGNDTVNGGNGNDTIEGGTGNDTIHGNAGDDTVSWNVGDGNDVVHGDSGLDVFSHGGDGTNEQVSVGRNLDHATVSHGPHASPPVDAQDLATVERIELSMSGGDDLLHVLADVAGVLQRVTANMGTGNDIISTTASSCLLVLDGDAGADRLQYDALGQNAMRTPGVIATQAGTRVLHSNVEVINVVHTPSALPVVNITTPTSASATTSTSVFITLAGTTTDDGPPVKVTWFNDRGNVGGEAIGAPNWSAVNIPLQQGTNVITVYAFDVWNNVTYDTITVTVNELTYSLTEGATGSFFDLDVLLANPTTTPAPINVTFLRQAGAPITQTLTLAPTSCTSIHVDDVPGLENEGGISTVVTSTNAVPLVVERTMFWDGSYYGSHGGTAVDGPRTRWLFAEGSEGFFNTFVLLANAGASPSTVTLTFLREGSTPFAKTVAVPANARVTVAANGIPELVGRSFSIVVDATTPILAERSMYFGTARLFDGGHESAGVSEGGTSWFLAEGGTGPFFETFVLVGNPNPVAANVTFTFLTDGGVSVARQKLVPANGRLTVNIEGEDPVLANAAVSTTIAADQPVIAERAMYWPGPPSTWAEAHNSFGSTALSTRWGLAEGRVGMAQNFQTYILLANPGQTAATVQITFLRANGSTVVKTFTVAPTSRFNVAAGSVAPELQNESFGALIEVTNGVGISVERAMYSDALGQTWAAGTNALATRLP